MANKSGIEWTEYTWNPTRGCTNVSEGCRNCYALGDSYRFSGPGQAYEGVAEMGPDGKLRWTGKVFLVEKKLNEPLRWRRRRLVFVNSMSDLFHESLSDADILRVFDVMNKADKHIFQVLTKRTEQLVRLNSQINWTKNIYMGVSVEHEDTKYRIDDLRFTNAVTKFLSVEPLLGPLSYLDLAGIGGVIVGGESAKKKKKDKLRPMNKEWVLGIREQCLDQDVRFHFKQWGGTNKKKAGRLLDGRTWDDVPWPRRGN